MKTQRETETDKYLNRYISNNVESTTTAKEQVLSSFIALIVFAVTLTAAIHFFAHF